MKDKNSAFGKIWSGKGFILTVCICAAVVGIVGYVAYSATANRLNNQLEALSESTTASQWGYEDVGINQTDVPLVEVTTAAQTEVTTEATSADKPVAVAVQPFIRPLVGDIINEFSNGELVKSKTLNVWQTHDGVDIAGANGDKVKSMTSGTVTKIYEDPLWGVCVIIDHGNGYEGHYRNLGKVVVVKLDEQVSAGTVIGTIGDTAECELGEVSHLHFGVKQNDQWVNPLTVITPAE